MFIPKSPRACDGLVYTDSPLIHDPYLPGRWQRNSRDGNAINSDVFDRTRNMLKYEKPMLQSIAQHSQKSLMLDPHVPLLARPGWLPDGPLPLSRVALAWEKPEASEEEMRAFFEPARQMTRAYWKPYGEAYDTYHELISHIERPATRLFFNGSSYRLLDILVRNSGVGATDADVILTFTAGRYFDALDTTDVLGYETAMLMVTATGGSGSPMNGPYRRWLGAPFDLHRRCAIPGVCTLTIRRGCPAARFILHERDPEKVALSQGVAHVTPAGEFQPRNLSIVADASDLNLWDSISREYAEEFLGVQHDQGQPLDEHDDQLTRDMRAALDDARRSGRLTLSYLGVGLDPLTWKPEILTTAVFDGDTFDAIFGDIVLENDEGRLIFADYNNARGIPFTEDDIRYWAHGRMLAAGEACLYLAWKYRQMLMIDS